MGGLILVASIIIWALSYFPHYETEDLPKEYVAATLAEMPADQTEGMSQSQIEKSMLTEYQQSNSILGKNRTVRRTGCTSYGAWLEILCFSYCRFCR